MRWVLPALLGAYHGLNPAMGWLFAVALGLQQRKASAVMRALPPIALGHAASVALILAAFVGARLLIPALLLRITGAAALFGFAAFLLLRRRAHPRWVGMRLGFRDLTFWSFLMSTAHGAGLMLLPWLTSASISPAGAHAAHAAATSGAPAVLAHTLAMFAAMSAAALVVFRVMGVSFLRRAWINLDAFWIGALVLSGVVTLIVR
jgi:hypothetical protein